MGSPVMQDRDVRRNTDDDWFRGVGPSGDTNGSVVTELEREIHVGDTATMHESSCVSMMTRDDPHKIGLYKL